MSDTIIINRQRRSIVVRGENLMQEARHSFIMTILHILSACPSIFILFYYQAQEIDANGTTQERTPFIRFAQVAETSGQTSRVEKKIYCCGFPATIFSLRHVSMTLSIHLQFAKSILDTLFSVPVLLNGPLHTSAVLPKESRTNINLLSQHRRVPVQCAKLLLPGGGGVGRDKESKI